MDKSISTSRKQMTLSEELNMLRAGVLGSNDGILTVAGVVFGVAAATNHPFTIFIAGLADLLACAFSMASGEYVSVSTQKDTEKTTVTQQQQRLSRNPQREQTAIEDYYLHKGLSHATASQIAAELIKVDPLASTLRIKYNIELNHYLNPWQAAFASLFAASIGGIFPLLAITLLPTGLKIIGTVIVVTLALALTGLVSAILGKAPRGVAVIRNIIAGLITMTVTYGIGLLFR